MKYAEIMRKTQWITEFIMHLSTQCRTGRCPVADNDDLPCPFAKGVRCSEVDYYKWNHYLATGFRMLREELRTLMEEQQ